MDETRETGTLVRRKDHRLIAGVAGGLADHFGVAPIWFRLGFVLLCFAGGMGVAAYVLLWFVIPREDLPRSAGQQLADRFPDAPAWIGIVLIAIGVLSLTSRIGDALGLHLGSLAWALVLIGAGLALFRRGEDLERPARATAASASGRAAFASGAGSADVSVTETLPAIPVVRAPRAPRERSPLGWLTLGLALAASGLVAVLRDAGSLHLTLSQTLAIPLTILGAGLLIGAWIGRARWTVLLGLPLVPLVVVASASTVPLNGVYEDITISRAAQVRPTYVMSGGRLELDLDRIGVQGLPAVIDVRMGVGSVDVVIPRHGVRVEATVNIGDVHLGRSGRGSRGGVDMSESFGDPNATTIVRVHVDAGEVQAWYGVTIPTKRDGGST
jgi:phage shock protein PspC (stress-responsive transcriptional regulator)